MLDFCEISVEESHRNEFERRIEVDILQHILFSCNVDAITYSNIDRPRTLTVGKALGICAYWMSWLAILWVFFCRHAIMAWIEEYNLWENYLFTITCSLFFSWVVTPAILWVVKLWESLGLIARVSVGGAEIGVEAYKVTSPVNAALRELIVFFADTKRRVVVFEDVDRFQNARVFTKLREACIAINRSPLITPKNMVRFIYCVRDDLFKEAEERTKFFDCIIPIIQYVTRRNVRALLSRNLRNILKCEIIPQKIDAVINVVCEFLHDARTVNNICAEFSIYQKILDSKFKNISTLFGLIVFKNLMPGEFASLEKPDSVLRKIIKVRDAIVAKDYAVKNQEFLRAKNDYEIWIKNNGPSKFNPQLSKQEMSSFRVERDKWMARLDNFQVALERVKAISLISLVHKGKIVLQDIVACFDDEIAHWKPLLVYKLIDIGCLTESYLDYVSMFHEGYLTPEDKEFESNVLNYRRNDWNLKLIAPDLVIADIPSSYFANSSVLNFSLLSFLLEHSKTYDDKLSLMLNSLSRLSDLNGINFINTYLMSVESPSLSGKLALRLVKNWPEYQDILLASELDDQMIKVRLVASLLRAARMAGSLIQLKSEVWKFIDSLNDISVLWRSKACTKDDVRLAIKKFHFEFSGCSDENIRSHCLEPEINAARFFMQNKRKVI